jgi:hypothetical protein
MAMELSKRIFQHKGKKKSQMGSQKYEAGAYMHHAATGVRDDGPHNDEKRNRLKKAFARMRGLKRDHYDENLHHYGAMTA